jgi:hypothetical protein
MCKKESLSFFFFRPKVQTSEFLNLTSVKCLDACHCRVACSHRVYVVCYLTCELNLMLLLLLWVLPIRIRLQCAWFENPLFRSNTTEVDRRIVVTYCNCVTADGFGKPDCVSDVRISCLDPNIKLHCY